MSEQNPPGLKYSKEHEWALVEGDSATIGVTHFAQDSLGDVVYIDLPEPGSHFEQFAKFGEIESVKAVSDLFIPLSGTVTEVNQEAVDDPELVNTDPYGGGWLIKVQIDDSAGPDNLMTAEAYEALLAEAG